MRLLFMGYTRSPAFQSPEAWIHRLEGYTGILDALARQHEVISMEQINYSGVYHLNKVTYDFVDFGDAPNLFPARLHRRIKKWAPDAVIIHSLHFPVQLLQLRFALGKKKKIFIQHHAEKPSTGIKKLFQRLADPFVSTYFFAAASMGDAWIAGKIIRSPKKIAEVMEASSVFAEKDKALSRAITGMHGEPVFLWVGRLDANKDPMLAVRSFLQFRAHHPAAVLYLIYTGAELLPALTAFCKEQDPLRQAIHLVPGKKHDEMNDWFSGADFIISSSHYEGSGIAICEAMSCGCIPLLTDIPSFRMMTNNGNSGILYAPGSEAGLVEALEKSVCLDAAEYRARVLHRFREKLSFEGIASDMLQAIGNA